MVPAASSQARAIIVDDAPAVRARLVDSLVKAGFLEDNIVGLEDPAKLMIAVEEHDPDIIFADVSSHEGDRFVLALLSERPQLPVIALGEMEPGEGPVRGVIDCGSYAALTKPIRPAAVLDVLDQLREEAGGSIRIASHR